MLKKQSRYKIIYQLLLGVILFFTIPISANTCCIDSPAANTLLFQLVQQALTNQLGFNTVLTQEQAQVAENTVTISQQQQQITIDVNEVFINQLGPNKSRLNKNKKRLITKFSTNFDPNINPIIEGIEAGSDNINEGLTSILEASTEIGDSLVGARSVLLKSFELFKKYKKAKQIDKPIRTVVIMHPGTYRISEDIVGGILVDSDDVLLDLNGHEILGHLRPAIIVTGGKQNVSIQNGTICGGHDTITAPFGILVNKNAHSISIENVNIGFFQYAIVLHGTQDQPITNCSITDCILKQNGAPLKLEHTKDSVFKNCTVTYCSKNTLDSSNGANNTFENCDGLHILHK